MIEEANGLFLVVSDARRREVFMSEYQLVKGDVVQTQAPTIAAEVTVSEWTDRTGGVVVAPLREWAVPGVNLVIESRISEGLLVVDQPGEGFSWQAVSLLEPEYLRGVSAKSIAERSGA